MAADRKPRRGSGSLKRIVEGAAIRHQRGRSNHALRVRLRDRPVHSRGKPKIIRVDNKLPQGLSVAAAAVPAQPDPTPQSLTLNEASSILKLVS